MEVGDKLRDLNMTVDEVDRLTKAFKDEKFKEMLRDYAQELSDPENKKRYEEEIKLLEQERGNTVEFIHPEPFRALRTSVEGKQKCFINICGNEKVGKPESKRGVSEDGRRGQSWSLPHSLHPGRPDTDPKGNKILIYDVIFHPDTLHIASKNRRFMDMVDSTALQGVQDAFKVTLDKNNVRAMGAKYKGTPTPCVIRKAIPGFKASSEKPDPLAFPYPDEKRQTEPAEPAKNFQVQPQSPKEPTTPNYTVKYRSFIDLQDFRCSRDSTRSPRPKQIVVTIDLPLLRAVSDASLEVKEKNLLLLESKKPAYRLELPLAYPVDEDKGEAKFNKQRGQLMVTLPVLPSNEAFDFTVGSAERKDGERQEEKNEEEEEDRGIGEGEMRVQKGEERGQERGEEEMRECQEGVAGEEKEVGEKERRREEENSEGGEEIGVEEEEKWKMQIRKGQKSVEEKSEEQRGVEEEDERGIGEEALKQQTKVEKGEEGSQQRGEEEMRECQEGVAGEEKEVGEKEKWRKQKWEGEKSEKEQETGVEEEEKWKKQIRKGQERAEEDTFIEQKLENETEVGELNLQKRKQHEDKLKEDGRDTVDQCVSAEEESSPVASPETGKQPVLTAAEHSRRTVQEGGVNLNSPKMKATDVREETQRENGNGKINPDHRVGEKVETDAEFLESSEMPATDEADKSGGGGSGSEVFSEGCAGSAKESTDGDDLPTGRIKPPPVLLREIDKDGNVTVISDHSTSAGFVFLNTKIYELD